MAMGAEIQTTEDKVTLTNGIVETPGQITFPRAAAASSLVLSAALLMAGKKKGAVTAAAAAGALLALEKPEAIKRVWDSIPQYLRRSQDFISKVEDVVSEISAQGEKFRDSILRHRD
jgi:hypothetical protein